MASVLRSLKRDPSLYPLVFAVGAGVLGSIGFASYYLSSQPDVVFRRSGDKEPWNRVEQGYNSKLYSPNKDWWASRADMPHPRAMFLSGGDSPSLSDQAALAKAKAIRAAKEKDMKNNGEIGKSVMEESIEGRGGKYGDHKESSVEH